MSDFNVIYRGRLMPGFSAEQVQASLGKALKITDPVRQAGLLSGRTIILKKSVSRDVAETIAARLEDMGAVCELKATAAVKKPELALVDMPGSTQPESSTAGLRLEPVGGSLSIAETQPQGKAQFVARDIPSAEEAYAAQNPVATGYMQSSAAVAASSQAKMENSSGQGHMATVPAGVSGWCWGGFLLGWIWAIGNTTWIGLLTLVPLVNIPMAFVLGFKGREWAWRNRRWQSVEHFQRSQKQWSIAGLIVTALAVWLWFSAFSFMSDVAEADIAEMEATTQQLRASLEGIEDPEERRQMEQVLEFQELLQKELEKQGH